MSNKSKVQVIPSTGVIFPYAETYGEEFIEFVRGTSYRYQFSFCGDRFEDRATCIGYRDFQHMRDSILDGWQCLSIVSYPWGYFFRNNLEKIVLTHEPLFPNNISGSLGLLSDTEYLELANSLRKRIRAKGIKTKVVIV